MPSLSTGTALWFVSFALSMFTIGLLLMSYGHFREARVCLAAAAVFAAIALAGALRNFGWSYGATIPLFVTGAAVLGLILIEALRLVKKGEPAFSLQVKAVIAFEHDGGMALAVDLVVANSGAPSVARDYRVTLVDHETGMRFSSATLPLEQSVWITALPEEFGSRRPLNRDYWLEGPIGDKPISRELKGFLVVQLVSDPFHSATGNLLDPESCAVEVECRDLWGHAHGPFVFHASKRLPIAFGVLSLSLGY